MKNKPLLLGLLFVIVAVILSTGCQTIPASQHITFSNEGSFAQATFIPVKNFESLGLVFTQVELRMIDTRANPAQPSRPALAGGNVFTYQELLKEAHKLGADAIINVTIDVVNNTSTGTTWYGSALAIKYTDILPPETPIQPHQALNPNIPVPFLPRR